MKFAVVFSLMVTCSSAATIKLAPGELASACGKTQPCKLSLYCAISNTITGSGVCKTGLKLNDTCGKGIITPCGNRLVCQEKPKSNNQSFCKNKGVDLTLQQFRTLFPGAKDPQGWVDTMNKVFTAFDINTPRRVAAFLAQCGHESGGWQVFVENLNYSAERLTVVFKKYFPTLASAQPFARQPQKIANRVYANRMGNGAESTGDGWLYRGSGPIQLTGKNNYVAFAKEMLSDWTTLVNNPDLMIQDKEFSLLSAVWFWNKNNLNADADKGDIESMTRKINGGYNGLEERKTLYNNAIKLIS